MKRRRHIVGCGHTRAFTLIEIMVVVAVIGIVAAIAIPSALRAWEKARVTAAISDLRAFEQALKAYNLENSQYPQFSLTPPVVVWGIGMMPPPLEGYSQEKDWTGRTPCGGSYYFAPSPLSTNSRYYVEIFNAKPALLRSLATELNAGTATNTASKVFYSGENDWLMYFITQTTP